MAVPVDPVETSQSQEKAAPNSVFNIADNSQAMQAQAGTAVGSTASAEDLSQMTAGTLGDIAKLPGGDQIMNVIMQGIELQIYNDMKRHAAKLKEEAKKRRAEAAQAAS